MLWREYFHNLLINRQITLHLAIWIDLEKSAGEYGIHECELPTLQDADSYPQIFRKNTMDVDGMNVRMSGMFGNATYVRVNGEWTETEYHPRDNTGVPAQYLSWAN